MLGIDKSALATQFLHLGNDLQSEGGFAGRLWSVNFYHPPTGQTAHTQCNVQAQRAGRHHLDVFNHLAFAQAHDGALAKLFLNLGQCHLQGFGLFGVDGGEGFNGCIHGKSP